MAKILIKNALLDGNIVDISINNNLVEEIGKNLSIEAAKIIDAEGNLVIPGFVDAHSHLDKCLLNPRAAYVDGTGPEKGKLTREQKALFTFDDIYERAHSMIKRAVASGTLVLRTNVDVDASVGLKGVEALLKLKEEYKDIIHIQVAALAQEGIYFDDQTQDLLEDAIKLGVDAIGGHTIINNEGKPHVDFILNLAKKYNIIAEFHLDESGQRQHYLLPYVSDKIVELGLQGKVNGIHLCTMSALNEDELKEALDYVKQSGMTVTIAPTAISTRQLAPVKALLNIGTLCAIGSDNARDFFNPLGSLDVRHPALILSYVHRFFTKEENEAILSMITDQGAKVLGYEAYGIKVGNRADLTILPAKNAAEVLSYIDKPLSIIRNGNVIN
ncbi:MAG: amidohydrolase family protein [Candidatus Izemoplasmataceae bacterium]